MAWSTPPTFTSGQVITATDLNTYLRDNENYLLSRPKNFVKHDNNADYTTTSSSFVDIDGTNLTITLTLSGSAVLLSFTAVINDSSNQPAFDFTVDGTRVGGSTDGLMTISGGNGRYCATMVALVTGLSAAAHTFKVQWRAVSGTATLYAGSGTSGNDTLPYFSAVEVA
jgi:hypothetical protein